MKFRQYVQGWREGDTPREYLEFTTKEELLSTATAKQYEDRPNFHRFSRETYSGLFHRLMAEFNDGRLWYIVGDISGTSEEIATLGLPIWKPKHKG